MLGISTVSKKKIFKYASRVRGTNWSEEDKN